jgi:hypothetical protein
MYKLFLNPETIEISVVDLIESIQNSVCSYERVTSANHVQIGTHSDHLRNVMTDMFKRNTYESSDRYIKCKSNVKQEIENAITNGTIEVKTMNGLDTVPISSLANAHKRNFINVSQQPELGRSISHLEKCLNDKSNGISTEMGLKAVENLTTGSKPLLSTTHKIRANLLDGPIEKAINNAGNNKLASVYSALRDLASKKTLPFTGKVGINGLEYIDNNIKEVFFTKSALKGRLKTLKNKALKRVNKGL